jgi:hypothetical protein
MCWVGLSQCREFPQVIGAATTNDRRQSLVAAFGERAINMMWKDTGINAVVAVTSVIWIMAVAWLTGDALWQGLAAI